MVDIRVRFIDKRRENPVKLWFVKFSFVRLACDETFVQRVFEKKKVNIWLSN